MNDSEKRYYTNVPFFSREWFIELLLGLRPLWEAWVIFGIAAVSVSYFVFPFLREKIPALFPILYIISVFIQVFWWVAIWRCAKNSSKIFFYLSRGYVIAGALVFIIQLFYAFVS